MSVTARSNLGVPQNRSRDLSLPTDHVGHLERKLALRNPAGTSAWLNLHLSMQMIVPGSRPRHHVIPCLAVIGQ